MQTTAVKTALEATQVVEREAPVLRDVRHIDKVAIGQTTRQGDLYLCRINPTGITEFLNGAGQTISVNADNFKNPGDYKLAPGNSTGSRHTIMEAHRGHVRMARCISEQNKSPVYGDIIHATARFTIDHPEHAHHSFPAGSYYVGYQLDWKSKQRVID